MRQAVAVKLEYVINLCTSQRFYIRELLCKYNNFHIKCLYFSTKKEYLRIKKEYLRIRKSSCSGLCSIRLLLARKKPLGPRHIVGSGELKVATFAIDKSDSTAYGLDNRGIVGERGVILLLIGSA